MLVHIGFGNVAVQKITSDQGINSVEELYYLYEDGVANLCKILCRPSGTNAECAADPRIKISARAKDNLKLFVDYIKHQDRVMHVLSVPDILR